MPRKRRCILPTAHDLTTFRYAYDADGRMTQIRYPGTNNGWESYGGSLSQPTDNLNTDGTLYGYIYNILAQSTAMQQYDPNASQWNTLASNATYNAAGQLTSWKEGADGAYNMTRTYNPARGWMTAAAASNVYGTVYMDLAYAYLDNGRASTVTDWHNPAFRTTTYQYDNLNRLTQATAVNNLSATQWQLSWTYDEFGNRETQTPTSGTPYTPPSSSLSYNAATNRITTSGYTYDNNGNMTVIPGIASLQYDYFDRVKQVNTSQYAYDAFGRRVAVTVNGSTTVHFFDIRGRLLTGGNVYFAGQRLGQYADRLGSVRYSQGAHSHYYPYGEEVASTGNNRYKFAETFRDSDTGLDYAINRYLSSSIGRFLSGDSYKASAAPSDPQTWNRYAYVHNDPVNYFDPTGRLEAIPGYCPPEYANCGQWDWLYTGVLYVGGGGGGLLPLSCSISASVGAFTNNSGPNGLIQFNQRVDFTATAYGGEGGTYYWQNYQVGYDPLYINGVENIDPEHPNNQFVEQLRPFGEVPRGRTYTTSDAPGVRPFYLDSPLLSLSYSFSAYLHVFVRNGTQVASCSIYWHIEVREFTVVINGVLLELWTHTVDYQ